MVPSKDAEEFPNFFVLLNTTSPVTVAAPRALSLSSVKFVSKFKSKTVSSKVPILIPALPKLSAVLPVVTSGAEFIAG